MEKEMGFVGCSKYIEDLKKEIKRLAAGNFPVLIEGPSGTGKELVAKALHENSPRKDKGLVVINCAAITKNIEESEFFGHVKGAYTGATESKEGYVSKANGSTLFLDEIGEVSLDIQAKLLRTLDTGEYIPVGDNEPKKADIRIISATNRSLQKMVKVTTFREDLYYRLHGATIKTLPLMDHVEDIPFLVRHFSKIRRINPDVMAILMRYTWPGNVRELRYTMEVIDAIASRDEIDIELVHKVLNINTYKAFHYDSYTKARKKMIEEFEQKYFSTLLRIHNGNISQAARKAKMYRTNMCTKLKKLGISANDYRIHK